MSIIQLHNLQFAYNTDAEFALTIDAFSIEKGKHVFVEGPSGCGKTTFLNLLTGLMCPTKGMVQVLGSDIAQLSEAKRDRFRADNFGIIFQLFNLIPYLSVTENIILPCTFSEIKKAKALQQAASLHDEAARLCERLELGDDLLRTPVQQLSIGQQQRVAIARAMMGQPDIIVSDEPTSALDNARKDQFMELLFNECEKANATLILVSHDTSLASHFDYSINLSELNLTSREVTNVTV